MALKAQRQDRLDLAEHLFSRIPQDKLVSAPRSAELLIQVLLDAGLRLRAENQNAAALTWLGRAYAVFQGQDISGLSVDAGELRLNVLHSYGLSSILSVPLQTNEIPLIVARTLLAVEQRDAELEAVEVMKILQKVLGFTGLRPQVNDGRIMATS